MEQKANNPSLFKDVISLLLHLLFRRKTASKYPHEGEYSIPDGCPVHAGLIKVLLDKTADYSDRDDAALDLGARCDDPSAEQALMQIVANPNADPQLVETCNDALIDIGYRKGYRGE